MLELPFREDNTGESIRQRIVVSSEAVLGQFAKRLLGVINSGLGSRTAQAKMADFNLIYAHQSSVR